MPMTGCDVTLIYSTLLCMSLLVTGHLLVSLYREGEEPKIFYLHPSLASEEAETQFFNLTIILIYVNVNDTHFARL